LSPAHHRDADAATGSGSVKRPNFWDNVAIASRPRAISNVKARFNDKKSRFSFSCVIVLLTSVAALGADSATVIFSLDFPNSDPEHYSILVQSDGRAKYESSGKVSKDSDDDQSYQSEFTLSDATRARIFELAAQSHYFSGKIDSGNKKLAFTGAKKLVYKDGQHDTSAEYNYSSQPSVQQLTTLFQGMAATLEFGRRLTFYHRYQKLGLADELKRMESEAHAGELAELQSVKPILQQIYDDQSVMNVVRAHAKIIMDMGNSASR
jgi:hypothetical protein